MVSLSNFFLFASSSSASPAARNRRIRSDGSLTSRIDVDVCRIAKNQVPSLKSIDAEPSLSASGDSGDLSESGQGIMKNGSFAKSPCWESRRLATFLCLIIGIWLTDNVLVLQHLEILQNKFVQRAQFSYFVLVSFFRIVEFSRIGIERRMS